MISQCELFIMLASDALATIITSLVCSSVNIVAWWTEGELCTVGEFGTQHLVDVGGELILWVCRSTGGGTSPYVVFAVELLQH